MDEDIRLGLQDQLVDLIMRVLVRHDELHYYQVSIVTIATNNMHYHSNHLQIHPKQPLTQFPCNLHYTSPWQHML